MFRKLRRMNRWEAATAVLVMTLWFCAGDPRVGRFTRWLARIAALYAFSPIDFIPDFIPLIGHLDDLLILPLASRVVQRRVPPVVWSEASAWAQGWVTEKGTSAKPTGVRAALWTFAIFVLLVIGAAVFGIWILYQVLVLPMKE